MESSKNGYEIRLNVLELAQKMLSEQHESDMEAWRMRASVRGENMTTVQVEALTASMPRYDASDVISAASTMYADFVGNSTVKK